VPPLLCLADSKTLQILLVEDDLEDEHLLSEAFLEVEEQRLWRDGRTASIVQVASLADALDCLRLQAFDAILLNLSLPDSPALLDSFAEIKAAAGAAPIVVLADEADENLANLLLREGAQDVLVKSEIDCAPLARAIRHAMERQRRGRPAFTDLLTGTLTPAAFEMISAYYQRLDTTLVTASVHLTGLDRETRDLVLIQAAEVLRATFDPSTLIGKSESSFQILTAGVTSTAVETLLQVGAREIEAATHHRPRISLSVPEPAILTA